MKFVLIVAAATIMLAIYYLHYYKRIDWFGAGVENTDHRSKEKEHPKNNRLYNSVKPSSSAVRIVRQWNMPESLKEISGITYLDVTHLACVQDEEGIIFIYNTLEGKIERQIQFASPGDFEGIALAGNAMYAVRSDGHIFEVTGYRNKNNRIKEYATSLTIEQDVEGLCFDKNHNRLLLAIKGKDVHSNSYKGIYMFDLAGKRFVDKPAYTINLADSIFDNAGAKKEKSVVNPSAIAIDPVSSDIYILQMGLLHGCW